MNSKNIILSFILREFKIIMRFKIRFITRFINLLMEVILYLIIVYLMGNRPLRGYLTSYFTFLIIGILTQRILSVAISSPYNSLLKYYSKGIIDIFFPEITEPILLIIPGTIVDLTLTITDCIIIMLIGLSMGVNLSCSDYILLITLIILTIASGLGIGLIAASMLYLTDARTGANPVIWVYNLLSSLISGIYYPIEVMPYPLQILALILPHTYAVDGTRRLFNVIEFKQKKLILHYLLPQCLPIIVDFAMLIFLSLVHLCIGVKLFNKAIYVAQKNGRLSRWV